MLSPPHSIYRTRVLSRVLAIPLQNPRSQGCGLQQLSQVLSQVLQATPLLLHRQQKKDALQFPRIAIAILEMCPYSRGVFRQNPRSQFFLAILRCHSECDPCCETRGRTCQTCVPFAQVFCKTRAAFLALSRTKPAPSTQQLDILKH